MRVFVCLRVCVSVCVCERERERERARSCRAWNELNRKWQTFGREAKLRHFEMYFGVRVDTLYYFYTIVFNVRTYETNGGAIHLRFCFVFVSLLTAGRERHLS